MKKFFLILINTLFLYSNHAMEQYMIQNLKQSIKSQDYIVGCVISKTDISIGLFTINENRPQLHLELICKTREITNFTDYIGSVLKDLENRHNVKITKACFGVPGNPSAHQNFIQPFNISFAVDAENIRTTSNLKEIFVVNDFEIVGYGIDSIDSKNIIPINLGNPRPHWPKAIVGAGDGLGSCLMVWDNSSENYKPSPLGFCYSDFAPHDIYEIKLIEFIKQTSEMKNVSWGYLLGIKGGIQKMYEYLSSIHNYEDLFISYQTSQEIFKNKVNSKRCMDAVDLYMKLYIRLLRNVAYITLPYGGLYITNSVVENNSELFRSSNFFTKMLDCNNDLLSAIIAEIPVYCVLDPQVKLYGAAHYCAMHCK